MTTKKLLFFILILLILVVPLFSFAAEDPAGLVPCGRSTTDGKISNPCGFEGFMKLINNVIDFIFKFMAIPIAAIMFAYAGVSLVTSGGSTEARSKAKRIFTSTLIGLVLAAGSWIIVKTLLSILGYNTGTFF